ncbi:hypothetical protein C3I54_08625 [Campylobacter jejuni]|uniref:hypothetical protein n=1 Tax=Campylobacter jejuni TaxID=197 RepID=UPI000F80FC4E|nr:hypothetical protein [Campylobacter jejuni]MEA8973910.1 hypothetical protein [Campylobacter jejuni]RTH54657.1 hypothetical protein C3I54_08625 [Campylobacter jejuni]
MNKEKKYLNFSEYYEVRDFLELYPEKDRENIKNILMTIGENKKSKNLSFEFLYDFFEKLGFEKKLI